MRRDGGRRTVAVVRRRRARAANHGRLEQAVLALHYAAKSIPASTEMVVEPMTTMFDAGDELPVPSQAPKR